MKNTTRTDSIRALIVRSQEQETARAARLGSIPPAPVRAPRPTMSAAAEALAGENEWRRNLAG